MKLKLLKKIVEAKGTKTFFWEPEAKIDYLSGQYYYFTLPKLNYPDPRGATRHFTISASPTEGVLRCTVRIRQESGYKETLDELPVGGIIEGEGPNGTFILDESEKGKSHVFLAGGIGITPFRSFIKYNTDKNLEIPMHLIYSNSIPEEIAFRKELEDISSEFPYIKVSMTISHPEESKEKWTGEVGRIDENLIKKLVSNESIKSSTFWVVGPPAFTDAMEEMLDKKMKIPSDRVRGEKFTGY